ncbi:tRNA (N(6)-L-threonylcarbamoyladenosine(37)-C(2))-methylthiotransferase [Candidatus Pacearchaeota archaeon]|nr:tRNA (N(6)-L-threonylcarbamoyladenosine(37)-C(2))-methylthiotransferase [Candidatus Pacearchaeota archaeon]MBD3283511.1 tRNA (N(6)-L-threonylcarbamoyladenosine(37)-C(2))-methylthiotransferase [Candidatus Pacearchaeota archaeon]
MKYIYIETYGCTANQNNSEIISGFLKQAGYEITNNEKIADIIIINTCIVKSKTENKIKRRIQDLEKNYKNKLMIITGCMPETDSTAIRKLNPKAILLGTHHFKDITRLLKDYNENKLTSNKQKHYLSYSSEEKLFLPKIPKNKLISITQILEGCLGECNFCKTRLAKGKLFSYDKERIIKSIKSDLENKVREIWITSQDNAAYGLDREKQELSELLIEILNLKHKFKLRLGMMNPNNLYSILNEMIEVYKNKKIYKFLHIPVQSASDKILKKMKRKYNINTVRKIINKFRKEFPDLTISTDIIAGYPGETEKDHEENLNFIKKFKPDLFNLSKFSLHKQTPLYRRIKNNKLKLVPIEIIKKRTAELMDIHRKNALENKKKYLGKTIAVFVNNKREGFYEARDDNYNLVLINSSKKISGKNLKINIRNIGVHQMIGEINH